MVSTNRNKKADVVFAGIVILAVAALCFSFIQCGGASKQVTLTPEQIKAKEDSIKAVKAEEKRLELVKLWSLGFSDWKNKEYDKALPTLKEAIRLDNEMHPDKPNYPQIHKYIAIAYTNIYQETQNNVYADSVTIAWENAVKADPTNVEARNFYRYALQFYRKDIDAAVAQEYEVLKLEHDADDRIKIFTNLKDIYIQQDKMDKALAMLDSLILYHPDDQQLKADRLALIRQGKSPEEYLRNLENMHQVDPDNVTYLYDLLREYKNNNNNQKVIEMCDKIIAKNPDDIDPYINKKNAFLNQEKYTDAIGTLQDLLKVKPNTAEYMVDIADCYRMMKQYATGRSWARRALRADSNYKRANFVLGRIYEDCATEEMDKRGGFPKIAFDDKLVFLMAADEYKKARNDIIVGSQAATRYKYMQENYVPKKADYFMNQNRDKPKDPAYQWILK